MMPCLPLLPPPALALGRLALFLDFDGTLSEIAPTPASARLFPPLAQTLETLSDRLEGRLALLSGRDVATLGLLSGLPHIAMAGVHGLERKRAHGQVLPNVCSNGVKGARPHLQRFVADQPGLLLEDKALSLALHYRSAPGLAELAHARARDVADRFGLTLQTGRMVVELRPDGANKGTALAAFMEEPPFQGAIPWMVGDDDTDESAFAAAVALGGGAVRVGTTPSPTAATHGLPDVGAVAAWLGDLAR